MRNGGIHFSDILWTSQMVSPAFAASWMNLLYAFLTVYLVIEPDSSTNSPINGTLLVPKLSNPHLVNQSSAGLNPLSRETRWD